MIPEKRIVITHCVDPHNFFFKYVDNCVNEEYSKFDCALQSYGNDLYKRQLSAHKPDQNELIIFFDVISNKWLRGRVMRANNDEITLWCIDIGVLCKTDTQLIQPLIDDFKKDFNLVQFGGVAVLPAESTLDFETLNVKMQVQHSWDSELNRNFKVIIDSAKRINFTEDMQLEQHKFGTLSTETWKGKVVVVNDILLQLSKAIACGGSAGMTTYISEKRMKDEFHQSLEKVSGLSKSINSRRSSMASGICDIETITNPFNLETVYGLTDLIQPPKGMPKSYGKIEPEVRENPAKSKQTEAAACKPDVKERNADSAITDETSSKPKESLKPQKVATEKSVGKPYDLKAVVSNGTPNAPDKSKVEVEDPFKLTESCGASGISKGMEQLLQPVAHTVTTNLFNESQTEDIFKPNKTSDANVKCHARLDGATSKTNKLTPQQETAFGQNKTSGSGGCEGAESQASRVKTQPDTGSVMSKEATDTIDASKLKIDENPFKPNKPSTVTVKCDWQPAQLDGATNKTNKSTPQQETPFSHKKASGSGKPDGFESLPLNRVQTQPGTGSVMSKEATDTIDASKLKIEENPFKPKKTFVLPVKCDWEPVNRVGASSESDKPKAELEQNPFKAQTTVGVVDDSIGKKDADVELDKPKPTVVVTSNKYEMKDDDNPFKRKKPTVASSKSGDIKLYLEPIQSKESGTTATESKIEVENPFKPKRPVSSSGNYDTTQPIKHDETSGTLNKSCGIEPDLGSVKPKPTTSQSKMEPEPNPFKPKKISAEPVMSGGIDLHLKSVKAEPTTNVNKSEVDENPFKLKAKKPSAIGNKPDGIELHLEPVKRIASSSKSRKCENLFKLMGIEPDPVPVERDTTSNIFGKTVMKNGKELPSKYTTPEVSSSHSSKSEAKARTLGKFKRTDLLSYLDGFGSIESIDKTGTDSVRKSSGSNKTPLSSLDDSFDAPESASAAVSTNKDESIKSSLDESFDAPDTISMAVSTIRSFISEAKTFRDREKAKSRPLDYECHLKTLKFANKRVLRRPMQSSIGWINNQRFPVDDDNESCASSIINLTNY